MEMGLYDARFFFKELDLEIKGLDMEHEQLCKINILKKTTNIITPLRLRMRTRAISRKN